ncbi:unnamed protein product [Rotaria sp. Silwood1]|nr:unnamed protein product [Rotaria sp. Silwood1]CAF1655645.1 unnamed protein product [Rotaria sp. Silwood1]
MDGSLIRLHDLPDEILMIILKKISNIEVLYSFIGVNKRLNEIVHDSIFTTCLTLMRDSFNGLSDRLIKRILDRFCLQILPSIHHKIQWLNVESSFMEPILLSTNYPNLYELGIYHIEKETASRIFTEESPLIHIFQNQILSLVIDIVQRKDLCLAENDNVHIFKRILTVSSNLQCLNFGPSLFWYQRLLLRSLTPDVVSPTLLELRVGVQNFIDCLYLVDGRFDQLRTFYVDIYHIFPPQRIIDNKKKIPNLKHFSLHCKWETNQYNELILPLLHRMSNLEELDLYLSVYCEKRVIDGYDLKENIITHLLELKKFAFNIRSLLYLNDQIYLSSNEDIQHSFKDFHDHQVISYVDYFSNRKQGQCQIYSFPHHVQYYDYITNSLSNGLFEHVREVSLFDERPFEHEFFLRIAKSFPLIEALFINNKQPQKNKFSQQSNDDDQHLSIIEYSHLRKLDLEEAHDDYVEQFLLDTKTCLPMKLDVEVDYEVLDTVTHNFTREATRINCSKLLYLCIPEEISIPMHLKDYLPYTKMS